MNRITVLLTDGFSDWEVAWVLGLATTYYDVPVECVTPGGQAVLSQGGMQVTPTRSLEEVNPERTGVLLICGGTHWEKDNPTDIAAIAGRLLESGRTVGAICGATLALARTGLLDGRLHTSISREFLVTNAGDYPGADSYVDSPRAVVDRGVITAPGTATATFTAEAFRAAGVPDDQVSAFLTMIAAEFQPTDKGGRS